MYGQSSPHRRSRAGLWFAGFTIACLLMLLASATDPAVTLQRVTTRALEPGPAALIVGRRRGRGRSLRAPSARSTGCAAENAELRVALAGAEQRIAELAEAARENDELRELLGISRGPRDETLPVRVISRDPSNFAWEVGIDAGLATMACGDGMPVVANADGAGALAGTWSCA